MNYYLYKVIALLLNCEVQKMIYSLDQMKHYCANPRG